MTSGLGTGERGQDLPENRKGLAPRPQCLTPSPWKSPYCSSPTNLYSSWPDALTSRAPVLQRKVALTHSGVPRAATTPRAHTKLSAPAMQKMTFFCWLGMARPESRAQGSSERPGPRPEHQEGGAEVPGGRCPSSPRTRESHHPLGLGFFAASLSLPSWD